MSDVVTSVPDAEDVPTEHREREQWLMWDASSDTPRRPHWRGNFSVSWTDPDDWHTFEEAREAALERDSWGIGYVFANTNDDYPRGIYGALDLDGCADEDGHPKEWLPSLAPFADRDAYIEWSPLRREVYGLLASEVATVRDQSEGVTYRDPYPTFREKLYWLWVRYATEQEVPPKSWVQLSCPESGDVIATEHTDAVDVDRDVEGGTGVWTYDCPDYGALHRFLWGPPAPLRLVDADTDQEDDR